MPDDSDHPTLTMEDQNVESRYIAPISNLLRHVDSPQLDNLSKTSPDSGHSSLNTPKLDNSFKLSPDSRYLSSDQCLRSELSQIYTLDLAPPKHPSKHPETFQCTWCPKRFTRAYNLRSHLRTHTEKQPFVCTVCGKAFARQHDRKRHEGIHSLRKKFVCKGDLYSGGQWGCGRKFARVDALGRHFYSESGRICIQPLLDDENIGQRQLQEGQMQDIPTQQQQTHADTKGFPMDAYGVSKLPVALLAQYPTLTTLSWQDLQRGGDIDNDVSGRSSMDSAYFSSTEYCAEDGGYVDATSERFERPISLLRQGDSPAVLDENIALVQDACQFRNSHVSGSRPRPSIINVSLGSKDSELTPMEPNQITTCLKPPIECNSLRKTKDFSDARIGMRADSVQSSGFQEMEGLLAHSRSLVSDTFSPESTQSPVRQSDTDSEDETLYSESDWPSTPNSAEQDGTLILVLDHARRQLVERVMAEFHSMLNQSWSFRSRGNSSHSPAPSRSTEANHSSTSEGLSGDSTCASGRKRAGDEDTQDRGEGQGNGHNKKPRKSLDPVDHPHRKFACPFFKRNPRNHRGCRSCIGPGWESVHRVKEHIYRRHALPIQCSRCCALFTNDTDLKDHHRAKQGCEIRDEILPDGFSKDQEKLLRSRKKIPQAEEDKWKEVYRILFPDEDPSLMPSPYYEEEETTDEAGWQRRRLDEFSQYESYLARELPRRFRRELESVVAGLSESIEDRLKTQLIDIVRSCQAQLFRSYQQTQFAQNAGTNDAGLSSPLHGQSSEDTRSGPNEITSSLAAFFEPPALPQDRIVDSSFLTAPSCPKPHDSDSGYGSLNSSHLEGQDTLPNQYNWGLPDFFMSTANDSFPGSIDGDISVGFWGEAGMESLSELLNVRGSNAEQSGPSQNQS